jgi:hypothetical protein
MAGPTPTPDPPVASPPVSHRRRLQILGGLSLAAGLAAAAAGVAYATLSVSGNGTGYAATGTLTFANPTSTVCNYPALTPSDLTGSKTCTFSVTFSGDTPGYVSLSLLIETKAGGGTGAHPLYDPGVGGLTLMVTSTSPSVSYSVPMAATSCPAVNSPWGAAAAGYTCYELDYELVGAAPMAPGVVVGITVTPTFLSTVPNTYEGGAAKVLLMVQAVQSLGNTPTCSATPPSVSPATAGKPCTPSGSFSWS